ncbi:MAG TPA: LytTR family DNA-binding domain-containing protein [Verrucomicrobiae bacterium]|jgi:two-component system, LytTR family, response regulator|nr:LytTR family DNA-binding domain-containing protein [Verrucomicrobiae bacterium]
MRVLMVDQEPTAEQVFANVLGTREDVESFDIATDNGEALEKLRQEAYDLLLLNVNLPSISGMELLDQLLEDRRSIPSVIFVNAQQQHAAAALQQQTVDHILKILSIEGLNEAPEHVEQENAGQWTMKLRDVLKILRDAARPRPPRIAIKTNGKILFIDPLQILSVHAEGNYVSLQKESGSYFLRESISEMVEKLKPYGFIRIHRSLLVNGSMVEEIHPHAAGAYRVRVKGGNEYPVARSYRKNLRSLADFWIGSENFATD